MKLKELAKLANVPELHLFIYDKDECYKGNIFLSQTLIEGLEELAFILPQELEDYEVFQITVVYNDQLDVYIEEGSFKS